MIGYRIQRKSLTAKFSRASSAQLDKALARGLTRVASEVKTAEIESMKGVFDRPTRYTLNALQMRAAQKTDAPPRAFVGFKSASGEFIPRGVDAGPILAARGHYLRPQVFGGGRPAKPMEARLRAAGALGAGAYVVPGWGATLDMHGNLRRADIVKILAYLQAFSETGQNTSPERIGRMAKRGTSYFVLKTRRGRFGPGVYLRQGKGTGAGVLQILKFVDRVGYTPLYDFFGVADKVASAKGRRAVLDALAREMFRGR